MVVISVYTYGVKIIKKFRWESGFLGGVPWNQPLCTNGSAGYLMPIKGVTAPQTSFFDCLCIFLTKLQHIGSK